MLEQGTILQERYRVERQIGQGGMGSVYLATDERFNSTVAIKETVIADDNFRKALKREARLLNSLKHVALPKVSDHFIEDNGQYIVMEYISGEDLHEMMERSGEAFPVEDVLIWAEQLLDALEYLHGQQNPIIHRDIKPQNLKLTPHGQIILLDFGLAKGNPTDANHKTAANSIFGYSRHYASLEQIQGTGTDPRSDIYSLAATLYHLVTGKPPADALTRVMNVMNEEQDPLLAPHLIHEQVDENISEALLTSMSLNANLRPQSASEMYELLFSEEKTIVTQKTKASASSSSSGSDLSTQNTKILSGDSGQKPSEIETEVLEPEYLSAVTRIKGRDTAAAAAEGTSVGGAVTNSPVRRRRLFAAAGALGLLLVGTIFGMVFYGAFDVEPATEVASPKEAVTNEAEKIPVPEESADANSASDELAGSSNSVPDGEEVTKASSPSKPSTGSGADKQESRTTTAVVMPEDIDIEEFKKLEKELGRDFEFQFKNGKLVGNGVELDGKHILVKPTRPGQPPIRIPLDRDDLKALTPLQRRRLRDAIEMERKASERLRQSENGMVPPPPPSPPKDPAPSPDGSN